MEWLPLNGNSDIRKHKYEGYTDHWGQNFVLGPSFTFKEKWKLSEKDNENAKI